jgi:hypothetical protein
VIYPEWLVVLVRCNPMTYAVDALPVLIHFHQFDPWMGLTALVGMALLFFVMALPAASLIAMALWLPQRRDVISLSACSVCSARLPQPRHCPAEIRGRTIRVCLPPSYPPLATGDRPGRYRCDLRSIAKTRRRSRDGRNPAMGRDFNPRAWRLTERTRGPCWRRGWVYDNAILLKPQATPTGWAWIAPRDGSSKAEGLCPGRVSVCRVALAAWLRAARPR